MASVDRAWISAELAKGLDAERSLAADFKAKAASPPDPALSVLYHEIAAADERHATLLETIATRYGHTPSRGNGAGIGRLWNSIKDRFAELGSGALDLLNWGLTSKSLSVDWLIAWAHTFEAIGDNDSARDMAKILAEEQTHQQALQQALNQMVQRRATEGAPRN
jgi:hypothetical protein